MSNAPLTLAQSLSWLFAGAFTLLAAQALLLALCARQREHAAFALFSAALSLCQWSAATRSTVMLPWSVTFALLSALLCARALRPDPALPEWYRRPSLGLVSRAWIWFALAGVAGALSVSGLVQRYAFASWAAPLAALITVLSIASHLAARLDTLRANIDVAKDELSGKVSFLEDAVARATENTERAEQAARVKDEFMATMSHELRTPLNAIINLPPGLLRDFPLAHRLSCPRCGALFELEEGDDRDAQGSCPDCREPTSLVAQQAVRYAGIPENTLRYLEKIERSGVHLLQVVNGILDAEQVKTGQLALTFGEADVAELTREVFEEMSDLAERGGVKLELDNVPDGSRLVVDRLRLRQVLINLISNAIKFSDRRGAVHVSVKAASDGYRFAVRDEGIGIAPENLENVFNSFEQVQQPDQRKFGGTGLGLFISRSLVRKHGGEMWVESTLGQGATFRFQLPRRERARSTANLRDSQLLSTTAARFHN
jgi:signal transduction histidine kinase